jgi:hypothetical protein
MIVESFGSCDQGTQTMKVVDHCVIRANGVKTTATVEGSEMIVIGLETRGFDVEVLLRQGFNKSNPRGDDSLWCSKPRP